VERTVRVRGRATYNAAGVLDGVAGAIQDVTELDTALRALGALNTDLEQRVAQRTLELEASRKQLAEQAEELSLLNAELGRAARAKDEFLAGMSHELRTPLTSVLNLSEAMQEGAFGDISQEQGDVLQTVQDAGRHLLNLINDILDLSKIEAGQLTLDVTECLAQDIARASAELTKGMLAKKHQRFTVSLPDAPVTVDGDPRRLKQILVNLLSNASKFTPNDGHISLELSTDRDRDEVLFRVTDDGIGIAAEDFGKLFRPFTQLDSKLSRHHAGTGLGLALVSRMAEMHGGGVRLESTAGTGSSFTLVLPWRRRATPIGAPVAVTGDSSRQPIDALILLADDNEMNRIAMSHYLRTRGFRIAQARNGVEAVTMAETHRPDLILMGIQMPDVDGLEATRHLRAHPDARLAATPVIALTALVMPGDREACLAAGADEYVAKPSPLHHLIATIDRLLTNR
jgi:signal transduction histidine kinase/ActR/RegA family two-component response regulator